jgi:hypothetical protein
MTFENNTGKTDKELMVEFLEYAIKTNHVMVFDMSDQKALLRALKEGEK